MLMSMAMTSGLSDSAMATASRPSFAWPATSICGSDAIMPWRTFRMNVESSTIKTRIFFVFPSVMVSSVRRHSCQRIRRRYIRPNQLGDDGQKLILLDRLGQKVRRAFLDGAVAVFGSGTRRDHQHGIRRVEEDCRSCAISS